MTEYPRRSHYLHLPPPQTIDKLTSSTLIPFFPFLFFDYSKLNITHTSRGRKTLLIQANPKSTDSRIIPISMHSFYSRKAAGVSRHLLTLDIPAFYPLFIVKEQF